MSNHDDPAMPLAAPFSGNTGLTKREYAAIHLRVPDSGDKVIDAMIRKARRRDVAVACVAGGANCEPAVMWADSLMAELEK